MQEETIIQLFEKQVLKTPDHTALIFKDSEITYLQLNNYANKLAQQLHDMGVRKGDLIAVCMERSIDLVISILAIFKANAVYLPLDPTYPKFRLDYMIQVSNASILITQKNSLFSRNFKGKIINNWSDLCSDPSALKSIENPLSNLGGEDTAYVVYTSGSTGMPKGVLGLHQGMVNRLKWMWETYPFDNDEVCCFKTSISFVDAIAELFLPLMKGMKTVIFSNEDVRDVSRFVSMLEKFSVTRVVLVPSYLSVLLDENLAGLRKRLKLCISSGEALTVRLSHDFYVKLPSTILLNLYGSSEVSADVCYWQVTKNCDRVFIGKPIKNMQVYILDNDLKKVPQGGSGELYISGIGLANGYLNRPEQGLMSFIRNPFSENTHVYMYKTGDFVKRHLDGNIEFLGRADQQVSLHGYRVELREIESALVEAGMKFAVVVVKEKQEKSHLLAYIVPGKTPKDKKAFIEELKAQMQIKLPDYMVPQIYFILTTIPLLPNGKVNRQALLRVDNKKYKTREITYNFISQRLQCIFSKLFSRDVGYYEDFYELGGNSILFMGLVSALQKRFSYSLNVPPIIERLTIDSLSKEISNNFFKQPVLAIQKKGIQPPLFLIHPASGLAMDYSGIVVKVNRPLYGINSPVWGKSNFEKPDTLEALAQHYISVIKNIQPVGPYYLGGWSAGGNFAYEVAQQLSMSGNTVEKLILIDSLNIENFLSGFSENQLRKSFKLFYKTLDENFGEKIIKKMINEHQYSEHLLQIYQPIKYLRKAVLIKADVREILYEDEFQALQDRLDKVFLDSKNGWGSLIPDLEVIKIKAQHSKLLSFENKESLSKILSEILSKNG